MPTSRRTFLQATTAVAAGALLGWDNWTFAQPVNVRVRQNVAKLDDSSGDIIALKAAILKMKALPASDARSWLAQSKIHGALGGGFGSCNHASWFFLPWHRCYLYCFEEIVRELSGNDDFALPYWDWSGHRKLPATFWGNDNPLNDVGGTDGSVGRKPGLDENSEISAADAAVFTGFTVISNILKISDFETFGGSAVDNPGEQAGQGELESTPHNFMHRWVGGDMVTGGSPYDPIFWLHHCNIDRLFSAWMIKHGGKLPTEPRWLDGAFKDFCDRKGSPTELVVKNVLDSKVIGYRYDVSPSPIAMRPRPDILDKLKIETSSSERLNTAMSFELKPTAAFSAGLANSLAAPDVDATVTLRVRLSGVKVPEKRDVAIEVYVNCLKLGPDTRSTDPSHIGTVTFFERPHHGDTTSFLLSANAAFAKLYADRALPKDEPIKVGVVTRPLFGDGPREAQQLEPTQVSFEVV